jgi:hypothetical protein
MDLFLSLCKVEEISLVHVALLFSFYRRLELFLISLDLALASVSAHKDLELQGVALDICISMTGRSMLESSRGSVFIFVIAS